MGTDDNMVRIWDMKTQSLVHSFEGHTKKVTALDFSENGYYMGSTSEDGTARLWDLRKLKNVKTLELGSSVSRWSVVGGRWTVDGGRWAVVGGGFPSSFSPKNLCGLCCSRRFTTTTLTLVPLPPPTLPHSRRHRATRAAPLVSFVYSPTLSRRCTTY